MELEAIAAAPKFRARAVSASTLAGSGPAAEQARAAGERRRAAAGTAVILNITSWCTCVPTRPGTILTVLLVYR
jgi:hypothetical protein